MRRSRRDSFRESTRADYEIDQSGDFATAHRINQAVRDAGAAIALLDQIDAEPARRAAAVASLRP